MKQHDWINRFPPDTKTCHAPSGCGRALPLGAFNRRRDTPDGRQSLCRECSRRATLAAMRRLRDCEARVRAKRRAEFDDRLGEWLRRHPLAMEG